eukprot:3104851-Prymnesium_polylepis.1
MPEYITLMANWMGVRSTLSVEPLGPGAPSGMGPETTVCLMEGTCSAVLAMINRASNHQERYHRDYVYTSPILIEPFIAIVHRSQAPRNLWAWTSPFEGSLWLGVLGFSGFKELLFSWSSK